MAFRWMTLAFALAACSSQDMAQVVTGIDAGSPTSDSLTFYKDVLPLAQQHCVSCHYPGGIGPFSMLDPVAAKAEQKAIVSYVSSGLMPPWKPADGCRTLSGDRRLTAEEADVFTAWAAGEAAAGDPADAPTNTITTAGLPSVSATMQMTQVYTPPTPTGASDVDHYQCFILDPKLTTNQDLIGYDVHPGAATEVHHVLLYPASLSEAQALDDATPNEIGWTCFGGPGTKSPQTVGGWVPGSSAVLFPKDTGIGLTAGQIMIMQVHYNLNYVPKVNDVPQPLPDQSTVMLQYASTPVSQHAIVVPILNSKFSVPPGAMNYAVEAQAASPYSGTVWGVLPHAHTNAQKMHMAIDKTDGCMVDIPEWDFHWQQMYFFDEPMTVNKGDNLHLTCTYNNPGSKPLTWGESTSDEMCLNYMYVTL